VRELDATNTGPLLKPALTLRRVSSNLRVSAD
jgi:hypothetical protein